MDRVDVTGHRGIPAADVLGDANHCGTRATGKRPQHRRARTRRTLHLRGGTGAPAAQVGAASLPDPLAVDVHHGHEVDHGALRMRPQLLGTDREVDQVVSREPAMDGDLVLQVDEAGQRQGKGAVGHELHLQGEPEYVRVGVR
ncbi:hypothetical protein [Nostocoides sp. HKS02]|uniref:hypothetical protein n=1 Tax=Nostocoides sp. HKS02 TaxID=1813880 RepID=UPI001E659E31|nr:hypothetical protein [Tetrasphaera sp. HKS02]